LLVKEKKATSEPATRKEMTKSRSAKNTSTAEAAGLMANMVK
jgi:hypothetical protein